MLRNVAHCGAARDLASRIRVPKVFYLGLERVRHTTLLVARIDRLHVAEVDASPPTWWRRKPSRVSGHVLAWRPTISSMVKWSMPGPTLSADEDDRRKRPFIKINITAKNIFKTFGIVECKRWIF